MQTVKKLPAALVAKSVISHDQHRPQGIHAAISSWKHRAHDHDHDHVWAHDLIKKSMLCAYKLTIVTEVLTS